LKAELITIGDEILIGQIVNTNSVFLARELNKIGIEIRQITSISDDSNSIKKALDLLAKGKAVNYEGATGVEFTDVGEAFGSFLEKEIKGGKFKTKKQR